MYIQTYLRTYRLIMNLYNGENETFISNIDKYKKRMKKVLDGPTKNKKR